ncbi:MAG: hypothetical protein PF518_18835 [Spirochaetaceae bacterium]|jgi:2-keto-3-deoxy-6-phosphogluconate aldolase|nr:hypothetical protein [Spirochaetaceae bacterium]
MNRLFSKLKDFGLIFSLEATTEDEIILTSKALKKADLPVAVFNFNEHSLIDPIKISNENEDMFLGAFCTDNYETIKRAMASGAHFIICPTVNETLIKKCNNDGFDLIVQVTSLKDIEKANSAGAEALVINCDQSESANLINTVLTLNKMALFLQGELKNLPFDTLRTNPQIAAYIVNHPFSSINEDFIIFSTCRIISTLLGLEYAELSIRKNSEKADDAKIFATLSSIPLFTQREKDLLTIDVKDMDRTIAHFKWKGVFMNPLSAKMKGCEILETELFTEFLGWPVKLVNKG